MKSFPSRLLSFLIALAAAGMLQPAQAQIGTVQFVAGEVLITGPAGSRPATRGSTLREGESIVTAANSSAQVRMIDQGYIAVRPETEMKFDQYRFSGRDDGTERGVLSLVKGGFRTITGVIGRINRSNYTITTPTSTIGIRGTDHEVVHVVAAPPRPQGPVGSIAPIQVASAELVRTDVGMINLAQAAAVPVPSAGPGIPAGSYNRVNVGATVMRTDVAVLNLNRNQVGYAPSRNEPPRFAPPNVVNQLFTTTARPGQAQKPAAQQEQQQGQQQEQQQGQKQEQQQGQQQGQKQEQQQGQGQQQSQQQSQQGQTQQSSAAVSEPVRAVAVVDSPSQIAAGISNAASGSALAQTAPAATSFAPTPLTTTGGASTTTNSSTTSSTTSTTVPIILTSTDGSTVNTTNLTVTDTTGAIAPIAVVLHPVPVGSTGQYKTRVQYPIRGSNGSWFQASNGVDANSTPPSLPSTSFVVDGAGKLLQVLGGTWNAFSGGTSTQCLNNAPCLVIPAYSGATPSPDTQSALILADGTVGAAGFSFGTNGDKSGSGAAEYYNDSVNGIRFGRYQGGAVNASPSSGNGAGLLTILGSNSALWSMREIPASIPVSGSFHYLPKFATAPTDNFGNVGTLHSATLDANFSRQTVNTSVRLDIAGALIFGSVQSVPIGSNGMGFNVTSSASENASLSPAPPVPITVTCYGNCPALPVGITSGSSYGASFHGGFAGDGTANGADLRYSFATRYDTALTPGSGLTGAAPTGVVPNQIINGMVGFGKGPELVVPSNWGKAVGISFYAFNAPLSYGVNDFMYVRSNSSPTLVATFTGPNGNLSSLLDSSSGGGNSITIGGVTSGASTVTTLGNGISFGRYDAAHAAGPAGPALTLTGSDKINSATLSNTAALGAFQWIAGPSAWPIFVGSVMAGTATYSVAGASLPTDQNGATGTFNSAALTVDFNRQSVNTSLSVTMPANTLAGGTSPRVWSLNANNVRLNDGGSGFNAGGTSGIYAHNSTSVSLNGNTAAFGNISGQLTGPLLNSAILSYTLGGSDPLNSSFHEHVNGVVGFGTPTFSISSSGANPLEPYRIALLALGTLGGLDATTGAPATVSAASISNDNLTRTDIAALNSGRIKFDSNGGVTDIDVQAPFVTGIVGGVCSTSCFTSNSPVRISINPSATAASGSIPAMPAIASGAATFIDSGMDPATGISWGRYTSGNVAIVDRVTGLPVGSGNTTLGSINHFLLSPLQSGPTVLPTSGTFNYTLVGNTNPTDSTGAVGTLNAASLSANFTAQTVNAAVTATVGQRTWTASASNMPILAGIGFEAQRKLDGTGTLSVGCAGTSCTAAQMAGSIIGGFTGTTGQGAGLAYTLNTGGVSGITTGGVAAFKR